MKNIPLEKDIVPLGIGLIKNRLSQTIVHYYRCENIGEEGVNFSMKIQVTLFGGG
jgi:hypothetical protein